MRPIETKDEALFLVEAGHNDCEIARRLGIPRTTVRDWRKPRYVAKHRATCPVCGGRSRPIALDPDAYAELLGLYLGDGHITEMARAERLRIFLDARYPAIVDQSEDVLRRVFPANAVGRIVAEKGDMAVLWTYSSHPTCLSPQHGSGKKHERSSLLEPWQQELVVAAPWAFLRGCIRSDGCVFVNRTEPYEYLSYHFSNYSADILDLFERTCLALDLRPRKRPRYVRLNRREDVARLLEHVGVKH